MKPARRRLVIVIGILVAVTTVGVYTLPRILVRVAISTMCDRAGSRRRPVALDTEQVATGPGQRLVWYGHAFEAPWEDGEERTEEGVTRVEFACGARIAMFDPAETPEIRDGMIEAAEEGEEKLRFVMGEGTLKTSYDLMRTCLEFDPDDLGFFDSWEDHVRATILATLKGMIAAGGESGIFAFETEGARGFQMGDPARADHVILYLFAEEDSSVTLVVHGASSQREVNRVVTTFRRAD